VKNQTDVGFGEDKKCFQVRFHKHLFVDVWYPEQGKVPDVRIELMHVRAADVLIVRYDFERDGWSIRMDKTKDLGGLMTVIEEAQEVAFVPAWNEDE